MAQTVADSYIAKPLAGQFVRGSHSLQNSKVLLSTLYFLLKRGCIPAYRSKGGSRGVTFVKGVRLFIV